ncbi:hypothetical protein QJS66_04085 [Kocuria rhizophila]|nr:hypothetical protein QJS66_04085 [Kocuria rhizophila]
MMAVDQGATSTRAIVLTTSGKMKGLGQPARAVPRGLGRARRPEIWREPPPLAWRSALAETELTARTSPPWASPDRRETTVVDETRRAHTTRSWAGTRTQRSWTSWPTAVRNVPGPHRAAPGELFAGPKVSGSWTTLEGAREKAEAGDLLSAPTDSWLVWNLTGAPSGACLRMTGVTDASRTLLVTSTPWTGTRTTSARRWASRCPCFPRSAAAPRSAARATPEASSSRSDRGRPG